MCVLGEQWGSDNDSRSQGVGPSAPPAPQQRPQAPGPLSWPGSLAPPVPPTCLSASLSAPCLLLVPLSASPFVSL